MCRIMARYRAGVQTYASKAVECSDVERDVGAFCSVRCVLEEAAAGGSAATARADTCADARASAASASATAARADTSARAAIGSGYLESLVSG